VVLGGAVVRIVVRRGLGVPVVDVVGITVLMGLGAMVLLHDTVLRRIAQGWRRY
jgi:hypothetical protein